MFIYLQTKKKKKLVCKNTKKLELWLLVLLVEYKKKKNKLQNYDDATVYVALGKVLESGMKFQNYTYKM